MKDERVLREEYAEIAADLIKTEQKLESLRNSNVSIGYLASPVKKTSNNMVVHAQCEKVPDKYKFSVPFDFIITVFESTIREFTPEQIRILLYHELLHVGVDSDGSEEKYFVVPHDLQDFQIVIEKYGMEWSK